LNNFPEIDKFAIIQAKFNLTNHFSKSLKINNIMTIETQKGLKKNENKLPFACHFTEILSVIIYSSYIGKSKLLSRYLPAFPYYGTRDSELL
jgi:hypothetical protein